MKHIIERIYSRTTEYSHPSQATTIANSLELLSSGIYTEEERFVFELLQNAVDSFNPERQSALSIKIAFTGNLLIFMHNGTSFSEKDLEGLCDIGNGNKMNDAKKIGYKGIGFKSVFMHSHRVTVLTDKTCFKFDKEACESIAKSKRPEYDNVKMPWQIIPILTDIPSSINTNGFNVITYIETSNRKSLKRKVEKLLNDARFLLFLKIKELRISFWDEEKEVLTLSKEQAKDVLTLSKNGKIESNWLIHSVEVPLTQEVKDALIQDTKTPTKLKESESVEISFAIALDKKKNITPIKNAVMYTFLPTSFSFGLDFIVNANFITDAGRQQIVKDCAWNEFIFTQIPKTYLKWMAENVAKQYSGWYEVLPIRVNNDDELSEAYANALSDALGTIPFVRTVNNEKVLLKQALMDSVGLKSAIPKNIFDIFVQAEVSKIASSHSIVSSEVGQTLQQLYGITSIIDTHVCTILEKSNDYLKNLSDKQILIFLNWLRLYSLNHIGDFRNFVSHMPILSDENHNLIEPVNSFFPSDYSDKNPDVSEDAKIIRKSLAELFSDEITDWLKELGVQEMSNLSVIEKVLCEDNYIHQGNAIDVLRFIFECDKKENVFANVKKSRLEKIKIRTTNGTLKYASELYFSDVYNPICKIQEIYWNDIFVSDEYPENESEYAEWALFLKKLGVNDDLKLSQIRYDDGSWVMNDAKIQQCIYTAKNREYNTAWDGRKFYLGCAGGICLYAMSSPLLTIHASNQMHDFYIQFWGRIFSNALPNKNDDYIFGNTGWGYIKKALLNDYAYLGTSFIKWVAETKNLIPASDGCLYSVRNVLINSQSNKETFGRYFPVLAINGSLRNEWAKELPFKEGLSLFECLGVLQRISEDDGTKDLVSENKKKINKIYEYIIDTFDFSENSSDFTLVRNWGVAHKILSKEGNFESPNSLYLLSSHLSGIELDSQAFHGKHLENERFESFMIALGVNMITDYRVEGIENAKLDSEINDKFTRKVDFLTSVATGDTFTKESWEKSKSEMCTAVKKLQFYHTDTISIYYGNQKFPKTVYSKANRFYFVGEFGIANQELLLDDIMKLLEIPKKVSSVFLTILQMNTFPELKEYIGLKGYDTSFINVTSPIETQTHPIMGGDNAPYGGLTKEQMRKALEEAKETILQKLSNDGFDISKNEWDGWTCIDGVRKDGIEYPLVIRSNKSQRNTCLSPHDWEQLMKPNAMFAVVTDVGIGTISLREILKSKEIVSIKFSSENIDNPIHVRELTQVFAYFKGIQFDFDSYIPPTINQWERFMAPEQTTGELPKATSPSALPE